MCLWALEVTFEHPAAVSGVGLEAALAAAEPPEGWRRVRIDEPPLYASLRAAEAAEASEAAEAARTGPSLESYVCAWEGTSAEATGSAAAPGADTSDKKRMRSESDTGTAVGAMCVSLNAS